MTQSKLSDLIDLKQVQEILNDFYEATGFAIGIIQTDGEVLVKSRWQPICEDFHRRYPESLKNCLESDLTIHKHLEKGSFVDYKCLNGLVDAAIPLVIGGEHVASLFFGQFFYEGEEGDEEKFRQQAKEFGFCEAEYLEAYRQIPVFSREQVQKVMRFCTSLVKMLNDMGKKNLELKGDLERQKLYEGKLSESEQRYRSLVETSTDPVFILDRDGKYLFMNKTAAGQMGGKPEDYIGQNMVDFFPEDIAEKQLASIQWVIDNRKHIQTETRTVLPDGIRWYSMNIHPVPDASGKVFYAQSIARDITNLKQVQKELEEHEHKLKEMVEERTAALVKAQTEVDRFFNTTLGLLCIAGTDGYFKRINPAWENLLGYTKEEILATPFLDFNHPDDIEPTMREVEKLSQGAKTINFTNRYRCKDGSYKWLNWTSVPVGEVLYAAATDITEAKEQEERYRLERNFSDTAINSLPGVFYLLDKQGYFKRWNDNFTRISGFSSEEMSGMNALDVFPEEEREKVGREIGKVFAEGYSKVEANLKTRQGNLIPFYFTGYRFEINDQVFLIGTGIDITELKEAEEANQKMLAELARSNNDLEQFAYVASHDLQEPLRKMSSFTGLLEQRYKDVLDEKGLKYMFYITDGASRMQGLINGLLQFSRVSTRGKDFLPVDMNWILRSALDNLSLVIKEKQAMIDIGKMPVVNADSSQIVSLMQNLIGNALKFCQEDVPLIKVSCEDRVDDWLFSVKDNGIGISSEFSEKVFVIFQRLQTSADYPGTGIGLAVCRKIVERHGGVIWFDSEPGNGTTFFFTIPKNNISKEAREVAENDN
ncbi:MAG: PAS domain S-box protein [Candidatus Cloacimonetes bacterium]|nr:PAS domain S-box protein [Candidatus Cloacimonadota bacterium]